MIQILTSETYVEKQLVSTRNLEQKCARVSPIMDIVQLLTYVNCPMTLILLYLRKLQNRINSGNKVPRLDKALASNGDSKSSSKESSIKIVKAGGHRAGYDAFMTGFSLATFLVHHTQIPVSPQSWLAPDLKTEKIVNKIYLVSKDFPLLLQKSAFAKCSIQHDSKMKRLGLIESD